MKRSLEIVSGAILDGDSCVLTFESYTDENVRVRTVRTFFGSRLVSSHASSSKPPSHESRSPSGRWHLTGEHDSSSGSGFFLWTLSDLSPCGETRCLRVEVHGSISSEDHFGRLVWSEDESCVVFCASLPKSSCSFEWPGDQLGEQLGLFPGLFRLSFTPSLQVQRLSLPSHVSYVSHPCFVGNSIYAVAHPLLPHHPGGAKFCTNKTGFIAELLPSFRPLPRTQGPGVSDLKVCGPLLVWTAAESRLLHQSARSVWMMDPQTSTRPLQYTAEGLDEARLKVVSKNALLLEHVSKSRRKIVMLNPESGQLTEQNGHPAWEHEHCRDCVSYKLLDAREGRALITQETQAEIRVHRVQITDKEWKWEEITKVRPSFAGPLEVKVVEDGDIHYILYRLLEMPLHPLVLHLHGGPHACFDTSYSRLVEAMLAAGFSVISPNYVGSTGIAGKDRLAGQIGALDVSNVRECLSHALNHHKYSAVACFGGSHGGFLGAHLSVLEMDRISCVAMRNPVIAVDLMIYLSDIPEWAFAEGLGEPIRPIPDRVEDWDFPDDATSRERLRLISPIAALEVRKRALPCLLGLGGKDVRVPWSQGKMWYYACKRYGVDVQMLFYPDEDHSLRASPATMMDWFEQSIRFMQKHTSKTE